jgi:hypothetical protein
MNGGGRAGDTRTLSVSSGFRPRGSKRESVLWEGGRSTNVVERLLPTWHDDRPVEPKGASTDCRAVERLPRKP